MEDSGGVCWDQHGRPKSTGGSDGTTWADLELAEMEAEVFLLGHWENYEELEERLSMPELLATIQAIHKSKWKDYKFQAAMQGVSLPDAGEDEAKTFEEIERRAMIKAQGGDPESNDVTTLTGHLAAKQGFGINMQEGLAYSVE